MPAWELPFGSGGLALRASGEMAVGHQGGSCTSAQLQYRKYSGEPGRNARGFAASSGPPEMPWPSGPSQADQMPERSEFDGESGQCLQARGVARMGCQECAKPN